jgi:hypothetical protein
MEFRRLNQSDYDDTLVGWWNKWRWTAPSKDFLPENGTGGIMVSKDGVDICAGFIYLSNSKLAWIEFIVSNFDYKNKDRKEAIRYLIENINSIAKNLGYKFIYTSVKNQNLINVYSDCGFVIGSNNCQEMVKIL